MPWLAAGICAGIACDRAPMTTSTTRLLVSTLPAATAAVQDISTVELAALIEDAATSDNQHALMYIDLDQFKAINDSCGHIAGDQLLKQVAVHLGENIRRLDRLARLGGDEFGVLLRDCSIEKALEVAEALEAPEHRSVTVEGAVWNEDGSQLALQILATDYKDRWLVTVAAGSDEVAVQHRLSDEAWINWEYNAFGWLSDGRTLWYLSEESGFSHLYTKRIGEPELGVRRLDAEDLIIAEAYADEGPTLRRFRPRARGRATRIDKRTSHITIVVGDGHEDTREVN